MSDPKQTNTTVEREPAKCRGCGRLLDGDAYFYGGRAFVPRHPNDSPRRPRIEARKNWYGGFVCSRSCDYRAALSLEQSMPGHGITQRSVHPDVARSIEAKWEGVS